MRHALLRLVVFVVLALVATDSASAADVDVRFCVTYNLAYNDASMGDTLTSSTAKGRGVLVRFIRPDSSTIDHYMEWNGVDAGCLDFELDDSVNYTVKVVYEALVNGNTLWVENASGTLMKVRKLIGYSPLANDEKTLTVGTNSQAHVLAAAGWAMAQHNYGVTGEDFAFRLDACPGYSTSCDQWIQEGLIYINNASNKDHQLYKSVITHEFGHAMADAANGEEEDGGNGNANIGDCAPTYTNSGHKINSKEFQSTAATEAMAYFYTIITFNDSGGAGTDCELELHYRANWNLDATVDADDPMDFSCEAGVVLPNDPDVDDEDFLGDHCLASGASNNRGTEYDWIRHLWDLYTDQGMSAGTIMDIWDAANPHTWTVSGVGTGGDYPAQRMHDAAFDVGGVALQLKYALSASHNGVDR